MIVTHYVCDRCGGEAEQKPGTYALFDVHFFTGEKQPDGKPVIKQVQLCKNCFPKILAFATTLPDGASPA